MRASVVLPLPGRAVEQHRVRPALLDRRAQRHPRRQQVLLADDLVQAGGPQARRQRRVGRQRARPRAALLRGGVEELVHTRSMARARRRPATYGSGAPDAAATAPTVAAATSVTTMPTRPLNSSSAASAATTHCQPS